MPPVSTTFPIPNGFRFLSILCSSGRSAIAAAASKPWPPNRARTAGSRAPSPRNSPTLIERLKRENPHRTGTTLLRELALTSGQNDPGVSASTLYRFLKQRGLTERQLLEPAAHKKFEAQFSNQIWQADMLFGPYVQRPGGGKMQVFLHAILDDASRLIPHAQFYPNQGLDACLDCLRQAVAARGVPVRLYIDNAKIYRSQQLARIAASLGISIVHTPPYQPEGRGKIERYFRTVRDQFLTNLDPKLSLSLEQLNDRYGIWLENVYHRSEHSALASTPLLRWQRDIEQVRQLPPATDLRRLFFYRLNRRVRRDCTFLLHNQYYEAPPQLYRRNRRGALRSSRRRRSRDSFPGKAARHGAPRRSRLQRRLASRETRRHSRTGAHRH